MYKRQVSYYYYTLFLVKNQPFVVTEPLLNIALSIAFINILFVCFSIINVNAEEDTDTLSTNDGSTVMESGWTNKENQWYYYDHGEKKTGWLHTDYWYYLDQDGKMVTGLASVGNQQYYFNQSGAMQTGWIQAAVSYTHLDVYKRQVI